MYVLAVQPKLAHCAACIVNSQTVLKIYFIFSLNQYNNVMPTFQSMILFYYYYKYHFFYYYYKHQFVRTGNKMEG